MPDHQDDRHGFEQKVLGRLREIFDQHPWMTTTEYLTGSIGLAGGVRQLTEQPILAVGAAKGAGEPAPDLPFEVLGLGMEPGDSMVDTMHRGQALLANPDAEHQAVVDRWDPEATARSIASLTSVAGQSMGRRTFGARPAQWRDLEDKLRIESIWASAGIPVADSRQVDLADRAEVLAAHDELAGPSGTVWAGDNRSGWHGGGSGTFWVPDRGAAERLLGQLDRFDRVRVMPFVDGVPCSMHGMVVPDGDGGSEVITFRPCEMLVLRDRARHAFVYCRSANFWDPDPMDRAAMADSTKRIGNELIARARFRGMFTVDGVMGADGFVPTEVNTRYGAALRGRHPTVSGEILNLLLLNMAVIEGRYDDVDLRPLGPIVTRSLDEQRHGHAFLTCSTRPTLVRTASLTTAPTGQNASIGSTASTGTTSSTGTTTSTGSTAATGSLGQLVLTENEAADEPSVHGADSREGRDPNAPQVLATLEWTTMGDDDGVLNVTLVDPPVGQSVAPLLVEAITLADRQWSLGVPSLEPATPVR